MKGKKKMKVDIQPVERKGIIYFHVIIYDDFNKAISFRIFNTFEEAEIFCHILINEIIQKSPE